MIDTKELRRLAQGATPHVGHACKYQDAHWLREGHVDFENADLFIASERPQEDAAFYAAANPATVIELLDRLEEAESDALEQSRLNGVGASREAALMAKLEAAEKERDALRAKIEAMEKQEPVARIIGNVTEWVSNGDGTYSLGGCVDAFAPLPDETKLYLAPGEQPAPSVPTIEAAEAMGAKGGPVVEAERLAFEAWMRGHCWRIGGRWNGAEYLGSKEHSGWLDPHAMQTRQVWAAWRDRAALAAEAKP